MNTKVFFLSKHWSLVVNMMIGIQQSLNLMLNFEREVSEYDYTYKSKLDLTLTKLAFWENKKKGSMNDFQKCFFTDYASYVFKKIRELYGINQTEY